MKLYKLCLIVVLLGSIFVSCEDEKLDEVTLPLAGTYALTEMSIGFEAHTIRDTAVSFSSSQNGVDSITIPANSFVLGNLDSYSDQDDIPVGGSVILNNDGSATLNGNLPVNFGTGCQPLILISGLASDGVWSVDTLTHTFEIDLVLDALDINGTYTLSGNQMELRYFTIVEIDERMISSINYEGNNTAIIPACFAVSTITERVMYLTLE